MVARSKMMAGDKLSSMLVEESNLLKAALSVIDQSAEGICFVVDSERVLKGVLTDGDIRRALLKGVELSTPVNEVMRDKFISLPVSTPNSVIQEKITKSIKCIPLVDEKGVLVDCSFNARSRHYPVMQPSLKGNELEYVIDCIKSNWISSQGKYVTRFEAMMAEQCESPYAVAVSNGTVALHLALLALDIGSGDEVIVPDFTFAASINAILHAGATPVIVDVTRKTWNIEPTQVAKAITDKTKAIMPVHLYGHPCDMEPLMNLAQENGLYIIEDCAEAIGSYYKGKPVGSFGDASTFSFFGNKTITTGEGGMVVFRDEAINDKALLLRDHGMSKSKRYWHEEVGFNYRLTNLQAAVGVAQLENLDKILKRKLEIAKLYSENLASSELLEMPPCEPWAINSYWMYTVLLKIDKTEKREQLIQRLLETGVETRPVFFPLHEMKIYSKYSNSETRVTSEISRKGISLPSYIELTDDDVIRISHIINDEVKRLDLSGGS